MTYQGTLQEDNVFVLQLVVLSVATLSYVDAFPNLPVQEC